MNLQRQELVGIQIHRMLLLIDRIVAGVYKQGEIQIHRMLLLIESSM